jgi:hypothetical protein
MTHRTSIVIPVLIYFFLNHAIAQRITYFPDGDTVTLGANPTLQAGWFHRFLFGSLWRDVWTAPVSVRVLHSDDLINKDYSFTPLEQDSAASLPSELAELLPRDIIADQIGTLNPYAPLLVIPILQAVNLPYQERWLAATCKNDSTLKSRRENYTIGLINGQWCNIRSDQPDSLSPQFISTSALVDSLENTNRACIDELQYLKSRYIDIFLGDWDRSIDHWQWISVYRNGRTVWEPVPLNHRQAFVRLNGLLPTLADIALPQLENCGENISSVDNLTLTGRTLDRRFLVSFTKQSWDSLALWLQFQLTDSVLMKTIEQLPPSIREQEGSGLLHLLQSRRAQLLKAAEEFYKLMSSVVEVHCSNNGEHVDIHRIGRHIVSVTIFDREDTATQIFQRVFHDDYTEEIRILLLDGDDSITLDGEESSSIKIIIDGGNGKKDFIDKTKSRSILATLNPFSPRETIFYTSDPEFRTTTHSDIQIVHIQKHDSADGEQTSLVHRSYRDWGSEWSFSPWFDINPDDGLFIGGGPVYTQYAYRMEPYAQQMSIRAGLATRTNRYRLDAAGEFRDWFRGVRAIFQFHASQLDLSNFFGLGNETHYSQSLNDAGFYHVDQRQVYFHAAFDFPLAPHITAAGSSTLKLIDNNPQRGTLLDTLKLPFSNGSLTSLRLGTHIQIDTRNNKKLPKQGIYGLAEYSYFPDYLDNAHSFNTLRGEFRTYFTFADIPSITFAFRLIGEKIWGEHPFFESAFLGGNESLRGFERQRFSGDASILGSTEVRAQLARIPFLVPLWSGVSAFAETGRVFLTGEHSNHWHTVIGGGVWFSIVKQEYIVHFSLARSEDKIAFYATMGFMF